MRDFFVVLLIFKLISNVTSSTPSSAKPSPQPTIEPTPFPTPTPTIFLPPSPTPTSQPTEIPTARPTAIPTIGAPTTEPTYQPTAEPSIHTKAGACKICTCYNRDNMKFVDCSGLGLTSIPEDIPVKTVYLLLQGNSLTEIGYNNTFGNRHLKHLKKLYLHSNAIVDIAPGSFENVSNIDTLLLHFNSLQSLTTDMFNGLTELTHFWLNDNFIQSIDGDVFVGMTKLKEMYLYNNLLQDLSHLNFTTLHSMHHLLMNDNVGSPNATCCNLCNLPSNVEISWAMMPNGTTLNCGCDGPVLCPNADGSNMTCFADQCISYVFNAASFSRANAVFTSILFVVMSSLFIHRS